MTVTRFAPSPTGRLHLGSMRTALFNYLYAHNTAGEFILRIDDTDISRSTQEYQDDILEALGWCGLGYNLVVKQSNRKDIYHRYLNYLTQIGMTYEADGATWLTVSQDTEVTWIDHVKGPITIRGMVTDWVLKRRTGDFTYNFCSVVDDIDMHITHIIRGEDHISNTAKQLDLSRKLAKYSLNKVIEVVYAHLPLLHSDEGGKLSKRAQDLGVLNLREEGILPAALINYLASLGWSLGDKEVCTLQDLIDAFDLSQLNTSAARINMDKLYWFNAQHLKLMQSHELIDLIALPYILSHPYSNEIVSVVSARCKTLNELKEEIKFLDPKNNGYCLLDAPQVEITKLLDNLLKVHWKDETLLKADLKTYAIQNNLSLRSIDQILRYILTGKSSGIGIAFILKWLGKYRTLQICSVHGYDVS
jgi:glutamyl-tRNA synthetase